jgi:Cof subfamily protein (haloacid dehalogenase superfamily)
VRFDPVPAGGRYAPPITPVRLLACDLDGTLCRPDGTVSDRTRAALRAAEAARIEVVLVTGRPPRFVERAAGQTGVEGPVICSNGAVVYDWAADEVLDARTMQPHEFVETVAIVRTTVPGVALAIEWATTFTFEARFAELIGREGIPVADDILGHEGAPPHKLLAIHAELDQEALASALGPPLSEQLTVTHSGLPFVEMGPRGVTKATGLASWCARQEVRAEEVVAFGDMPNDIPMLRWAGWGVAMGNGHVETLEAADEVTATNDEDGVAIVVERLLRDGGYSTASAAS